MKIKCILRLVSVLFISLYLFVGCAKIVAPTGGPKDEEHPLIVESNPAFNTTNFDKTEIKITFNEYIQLKELNSSLIVSPPLEEKPEIKIKGKTLNIEFMSPLKDSTTYNIYFGNSVQDINEGNPIENFQYVLSTGSSIDSLSLEGQVLNSFNLLPEKDVFVMLYNNFEDSVPLKRIPDYVSKTNEEGIFRINNVKLDEYKLFCTRDLNRNYLFDLPDEEIAFIDSLVRFDLVSELVTDTVYKTDTTVLLNDNNSIDSIPLLSGNEIDTIITEMKIFYPVNNYVLMLFKENKELQFLANSKRDSRHKIELMFNKPIKDSIVFNIADTLVNKAWFIKETSVNKDTIFYWLTDSTIYKRENIDFIVSYQKEDSNLVYQWNTDTLGLRFFEPKKRRRDIVEIPKINYYLNTKERGTFDLNKQLKFLFETPLAYYDTSKIKLYAEVDTLDFQIEYDFIKDSSKLRAYDMVVDWSEDTIYRLELYPESFVDIYEHTNDTSILRFKTQKFDYYGKILANITSVDSSFQLITQLILPVKEEEAVFLEKIIRSDQVVEFDYLPPKEFIFKVIVDKNFNGKWDTGEYLEHIQPEEVLYHKEKLKVRSNWDYEFSFDIKNR